MLVGLPLKTVLENIADLVLRLPFIHVKFSIRYAPFSIPAIW
jgi:hypothetical protein